MSTEYTKTNWQDGDIITADKMNNIENGIERLDADTTQLKEDLYYTVDEKDFTNDLIEGSYIKTAVDVGNIVDMTPISNSSFAHIVILCYAGANFVVTGSSGSNPRLWAFVDKDDKMLAFAANSITGNNLELTAPSGTAKAIFNVALYASRSIVQKNMLIPVKEYLAPIAESVSQNNEALSQVTLTSRQLFNRYAITENKAYSADGQNIEDDSTKCLSDFIAVESGSQYSMLACVGRILFFNADKEYLTAYSAQAWSSIQTTTAPDNAWFVRLEMSKYYYPYAQTMLIKGSSLSTEIQFGSSVDECRVSNKKGYEFSDIPIPQTYSAIGVKAVDGTQDFDDDNPSVSDLYDAYDALVSSYPDYITKQDLGMDESNTYHLYAYYFSPEDVPTQYDMYRKPYPKVNLRSGIHGNGTQGDSNISCFCLYYLMKSICENWREPEALEYLRWNVRFAIIPLQNPWGFENKKRFNSNGVDINRNFSVGWQLGTSGNPDYGGATPMSEAETNIIATFENDNSDAIFSLDVHSQGGVPNQNQMSYTSLFVESEMFYPAKALVTKMSHLWDSQSIPNLTAQNFHGYVACEYTGWGTGTSYIQVMIGTPALTVEGFKNFANSPYTNGSVEVVKMVADQLGYGVLLGLSHFK